MARGGRGLGEQEGDAVDATHGVLGEDVAARPGGLRLDPVDADEGEG